MRKFIGALLSVATTCLGVYTLHLGFSFAGLIIVIGGLFFSLMSLEELVKD